MSIAVSAHNKHNNQDDHEVNTVASVNFLLVNIFPTLIRQNFLPYGIQLRWRINRPEHQLVKSYSSLVC